MPAARSGTARSSAVCLDAGVVVRRFLPGHPQVRRMWSDVTRSRTHLVAPLLLRYEVTNAFHRIRRAGGWDDAALSHQLSRVLALPIEYHDDVALHAAAARIAAQHDLPATYDAHYLALAESLGTDLWTTDGRLAKAVGDQLPWVRLIG